MKAIKHNQQSFTAALAQFVTDQRNIEVSLSELTFDSIRHAFVHGRPELCAKVLASIKNKAHFAAAKALITKVIPFTHELKGNVLELGKGMQDNAKQKRLKLFEEIEGQFEDILEWYKTEVGTTTKAAPSIDSVAKRMEKLVEAGEDPKKIALALLSKLTLTQDDMLDILGQMVGAEFKVTEEVAAPVGE